MHSRRSLVSPATRRAGRVSGAILVAFAFALAGARHHPRCWDGTVKKAQSFLPSSMSAEEIVDARHEVLKQNRDAILGRGTRGMFQIHGRYNGVDYTLGLDNGRVGQFYPR